MTPLQQQLQLAIKMISGGINEQIVVESLVSVLSEAYNIVPDITEALKKNVKVVYNPNGLAGDSENSVRVVCQNTASNDSIIDADFCLADAPHWYEEKAGW